MDTRKIIQQAEAAAAHGEHLSREKDAHLYQCALDRGDFETISTILERAQYDPQLEEIINDIHASEMEGVEELSEEAMQRMRETVQKVLREHGYGEDA
jgi:hypothetical protein